MEWRHRHILDLDSWDRSELQHIPGTDPVNGRTPDRPIKKVPLRGKLVVNLFRAIHKDQGLF